jgi:hypothetical protein
MTRGLEKDALRKEWDLLQKDWYSIYQWHGTCRAGYAEWIAQWIAESFADIRLVQDGLREQTFKTQAHRGQAKLQTQIEQFTEKRFVRAIFNLGQLQPLGEMIDYEVPLKQPKAKGDAKHGDIDLLCRTSDAILCVEAKDPRDSSPVLKAILQAFAYTSLASIRRDAFVADFNLPTNLPLTPAILIGRKSIIHIKERRGDYPHFGSLLELLNTEPTKSGAGKIRLFVIENKREEVESCLRIDERLNGDNKMIFANGFNPDIRIEKGKDIAPVDRRKVTHLMRGLTSIS